MEWQGAGDSLGLWPSKTCPSRLGLLLAVDAERPPVTPLVSSPLRHTGARTGIEYPQPHRFPGKVIETVSQRRKRRAEKGERTGREARKRTPHQQDQDHPDSRSRSCHGLRSWNLRFPSIHPIRVFPGVNDRELNVKSLERFSDALHAPQLSPPLPPLRKGGKTGGVRSFFPSARQLVRDDG